VPGFSEERQIELLRLTIAEMLRIFPMSAVFMSGAFLGTSIWDELHTSFISLSSTQISTIALVQLFGFGF
jgi:hypothetical protein